MEVDVLEYSEVFDGLKKANNSYLLLGNGFSIDFDHNIFSYRALRERMQGISDLVKKLFDELDTFDIEKAILYLEAAALVVRIDGQKNSYQSEADALRKSFVETLSSMHPNGPHQVDNSAFTKCREFLEVTP